MRAVYEAGPTGFGLARAARERGIDVRVAAPGSIPKGSGGSRQDRPPRRDPPGAVARRRGAALRVRADASPMRRFRDLVRAIEDVRGDLMRARHRLSKFLLRRGERYPGPGRRVDARAPERGCARLRFDDACSRATFADYLAAVELLGAAPRRADRDARAADPRLQPRAGDRAPALLSGHRHALGRRPVRRGRRLGGASRSPTLLSGFLGIVPSERTSDTKRRQGAITKAGPGHARRLLVEAAQHYRYPPRIGADARAPPSTARTRA